MRVSDIDQKLFTLASEVETELVEQFRNVESVAFTNSLKVLNAFQDNKVSETCFNGTTGYGYDDFGRDTLDKIYASIFNTESALVRLNFVNGTHAISTALYSMVKPGDTILSVTGTPYDTIRKSIGISGDEFGSLKYYGVNYKEGPISLLTEDNSIKAVIMQRSCGYDDRNTLSIEEIKNKCDEIHKIRDDVYIFCDNCYGEFVDVLEPTDVGVDLVAGSLIKNPGGGIAPTGAYIAGKKILIDRCANHLTCPGIGGECGSTLGNNRLLYQGLFLAPHTVSQAVKTAIFTAGLLEKLGFKTKPSSKEKRYDIIQKIYLNSSENMLSFCEGIQSAAPVDSYVKPIPWNMPGYDCEVIMADGSFIQGSSIELSCDGPFKDPYIAYMQGGLTYESAKLGVLMAVSKLI